MNRTVKFQGVAVPLATPFDAQGHIDAPASARLVEHVASQKLGVFVLGTTGEAASINPACRRRLVEIAVATTQKRVPVFAGISDNCVASSISAARDYLALGADAVVALLPSYYTLKPAEMLAYFEHLAREIPGPIIIYNIPATTRMSIPLDIVETLSHLPNIVGLKDSEATDGRLEQIASRFAGRPDFSIFMGIARLSVPALKLGFDGLVPSSGNIAPALWQTLYTSALAKDWETASQLQSRLDNIAQVFQRDRTLGESLAALKGALSALKITGPSVLPPLQTLPPAALSAIEHELASLALA